MYFRGLFAACAAVVLCATVVESVEAYPITARSGATTVTGMYRPLDLDLSIVAGSGGFSLDVDGYASLTLVMTGTYTGVGYSASGSAGNWELNLNFEDQAATVVGNVITAGVPSYFTPASLPYFVGTLEYTGSGDFSGVPLNDTPQIGDTFELFAEQLGGVLEVTCSQDVSTCGTFTARLLQALTHQGPYIQTGSESTVLDDGTLCQGIGGFIYPGPCDPGDVPRDTPRNNDNCTPATPCGIPVAGFDVSGANIPEPASLALVGLGLAALALGGRRRQARLRVPADAC